MFISAMDSLTSVVIKAQEVGGLSPLFIKLVLAELSLVHEALKILGKH
jgi:hypothetical protein